MPRRLMTLALLLTLTACGTQRSSETQTPTVATNGSIATSSKGLPRQPSDKEIACLSWKIISFDRLKDTLQTIAEVKSNNAARRTFCS